MLPRPRMLLGLAVALVLVAAPPVPAEREPPAGSRAGRPGVDPVEAAWAALSRVVAGEPSIAEVQAAAGARAAAALPGASGTGRRRVAALLPRVTAEYRADQRSYRVAGLQGSGEVDYVRSAPGQVFAVRATWELSALLAPPAPAPAGSAAAERAKRADEAARRATELFFERRRLQLGLLADPPVEPRAQLELEVDIARLTAELDLLTGGLFARAGR